MEVKLGKTEGLYAPLTSPKYVEGGEMGTELGIYCRALGGSHAPKLQGLQGVLDLLGAQWDPGRQNDA